jgi:hypothetical protein
MNNSQIQNLFDSVCRCFGHQPGDQQGGPTVSGVASSHSMEEQQHMDTKRRTNRLGSLHDEQWNELFKNDPNKQMNASQKAKGSSPNDVNTAQALAQAKLAANPPRYNRTKRKRPEKARDEIFRSKETLEAARDARVGNGSHSQHAVSLSRLIHPSLAMCFATPIRGTDEEDARSEMGDNTTVNSDSNTLNTCEDTITSTVYYESTKLAHLKETRPPMPLFHQFKVDTKDELRNVMTQDTHSSVNMIRLLQQQQAQARKAKAQPPRIDEEMQDAVPDVKAVSDSSGSDGSMRQTANPRRKVTDPLPSMP